MRARLHGAHRAGPRGARLRRCPCVHHRVGRQAARRSARREVRSRSELGHAGRRDAAPRCGFRHRARRPRREDHHLQREQADRRQVRHRLDERQVRLGHRRHHRQVHDQGRYAVQRNAQPALRRPTTSPRCGQVRRLRRNRHRQPREDGHPCGRDHVFPGRRDRHAEPLGTHARQHPPAQGLAPRWARTRSFHSFRSAGASAFRRPGTSAATTTRKTSRSRS